MAMQTAYLKEHEGIVHNSVGQLSSGTSAPWWNGLGSQPVYGDYCGQNKPFSLEFSNYIDPFAGGKQAVRGAEPVIDRGHATQFSIFPALRHGQKMEKSLVPPPCFLHGFLTPILHIQSE
ncbi:uncharacterized protein HKW66_Vig0188300 [Vigna angularis]|uniref:Uncharacterized protein n=1 Tax=Phaseolus angularis TaxID=3914 RepID=A0A8T0KZC9_PHAAN|nr:uncharacterized protein HKW66_Vig0188300 [Vigna angularis]